MHHKAQAREAIHRDIAYILKRYIADPRLQSIAVTGAALSRKLDYADIYITQLDARFTEIETLESLQKAAPKIRYHLAQQRTHARTIPKLRFHYDSLLMKGTHLSQLIDQVVGLH
jgi:ribosome-binding factor A